MIAVAVSTMVASACGDRGGLPVVGGAGRLPGRGAATATGGGVSPRVVPSGVASSAAASSVAD